MQDQIKLGGSVDEKVVAIVRAAGGSLTGRTRLQKTFYVLEMAGFLDGFDFEYRHYGPYSEDLSQAVQFARMAGALTEEEKRAAWGGMYSIFRATGPAPRIRAEMQQMIDVSIAANPIELELAATAVYLFREGYRQPWDETAKRKTDKAQYVADAKQLYAKLAGIRAPSPLPDLSTAG
jgi:uncharacterized protein YwgA